jgi:ligand-binding SRPBCC domain-containing protein
MKILIKTPVTASPNKVWQGFDESLFLALAPPFPPMRLDRFDGCMVGDEVHLRLWMGDWVRWHAQISEQSAKDGGFKFIDVGVVLPFFIRKWQHTHHILPDGLGGSVVIDEIEYTPNPWFFWMYPALFMQFYMRKPVYRRLFS